MGVHGSEPSIEALRGRRDKPRRPALLFMWLRPGRFRTSRRPMTSCLTCRSGPDQLADVESKLNKAIGRIVPAGASIEVTARVETGRASAVLIEESRGADLLVVGNRGRERVCGGAARVGERALRTTRLMVCGCHRRHTSPLSTGARPRSFLALLSG